MKNLTVKLNLEIPVRILTKKISNTKTNSIFYAGKTIAEVFLFDGSQTFSYILTTKGEYSFYKKIDDNAHGLFNEKSNDVKTLTDKKIKKLSENDLINNWGWFTIEVQRSFADGNVLNNTTTDIVFSTYDEAITGFISYIKEEFTYTILDTVQK